VVTTVSTFLMFEGSAADAVDLYATAFPDLEVVSEDRRPDEEGGESLRAEVVLHGHRLRVFDSEVPHAFTFTPSVSLFVDFDDEAAFQHALDTLSPNGVELMAPGDYGFSSQFAWIQDRFGVSWQLNLT
jgi:predicted 3-demethylubiquinone-9 3-methyltransferase (glyoxalase superfamily)